MNREEVLRQMPEELRDELLLRASTGSIGLPSSEVIARGREFLAQEVDKNGLHNVDEMTTSKAFKTLKAIARHQESSN